MATKEYMREYMKKWRERNIEKSRKIQRVATLKWAKKTKNKSAYKWAKNNPNKVKAEQLIGRLVRKGILKKKSCMKCKNKKTHAHHPDYTQPLVVIWLCPACHSAEHKKIYE